MAYMGRGGFSSFSGGDLNGRFGPNDDNNNHNARMYYRGGFFRMYYYIPLDNTYVIFQMIAALIIFAVAGITFLITYKPSVIDPIAETKSIILNTYIIITLVLLALTLLSNYFSKEKTSLIKKLVVIMLLSIITIFVFIGTKASMDSTYTKNKFEQIYDQEYSNKNSETKSKIDISLTGMSLKTEKEFYIDELVKAYNMFSIRMYVIFALNVLIIILLIYQIAKVSTIQEKRDRLIKDDAILFDEEKNIKF